MTNQVIGVTGARGFIGSHVVNGLRRQEGIAVRTADRETFASPSLLGDFVNACDSVIHLAGMNRGDDDEIYRVNLNLAKALVEAARGSQSPTRIVFASSTQDTNDTPYGSSKRDAANLLSRWACSTGQSLTTLVIPNVFGPGCRPFYNSVVATFCHQLATGEQPQIIQDQQISFLHVNQLVDEIVAAAQATPGIRRIEIRPQGSLMVSELLATLESFRDRYFDSGIMPDLSDRLRADLFTTFLSYLDDEALIHRPQLHVDPRGELFEAIRHETGGQFFFSTTKPGIIRGEHYHTHKIERFCVVKGEATIRLRHIDRGEVREFPVSGSAPEIVHIPTFHTHHIENTGAQELLTLFWCNELFDPADADTYGEPVYPEAAAPMPIARAA